MSKAGAGLVAPMGFSYDADKTILENARAAWDVDLARTRAQKERNAKVAARRVFRTDDLEFIYESFDAQTPMFDLEDERIAYHGDTFVLVDFCGGCGRDYRGYRFNSLAGLGSAIEKRDDEPEPYLCKACEYRNALGKLKHKAA